MQCHGLSPSPPGRHLATSGKLAKTQSGAGTRARLAVLMAVTIVASLLTIAISGQPARAVTWYNNNYHFKRVITIDHTKVSGAANLSNYPVLISLTDTNLQTVGNGGSVRNANGFDIIFTDSTETVKLDHEIETYVASTGQIDMWVRIPTLSFTVDTVIYMYYSNSLISTTQENVTGVWNANYKGVWHLNESSGSTNSDSTSSAYTATKAGTTVPSPASGEIGGAQSFNGSTAYETTGVDPANTTGDLTVEAWVNPSTFAPSSGSSRRILQDNVDGNHAYQLVVCDPNLHCGTPNGFAWGVNKTSGTQYANFFTNGGASLATGTWYHVVGTFVAGSNTPTIYVNGVAGTSSGAYTSWGIGSSTTHLQFGEKTDNTSFLSGGLDEVRVSNSARSVGWIDTEYNNENSPSTFVTAGATVSLNAPSTPTSLTQYQSDGTTVLNVGDWTTQTTVVLKGTVSDADLTDQDELCVEIQPIATAFTGTETCTALVDQGSTTSVTDSTLANGSQYHWRARAKDAGGSYSSYLSYGGNLDGSPADRDVGVDSTAPATGTVYDGGTNGSEITFYSNSLSSLSANWTGFSDTASGITSYDYSIGITAGGTTMLGWTNTALTNVTAGSLNLQTSQKYYFNVRANDGAGNQSAVVSSVGQFVQPTMTLGVSATTLTFQVNASNSYTDTKTVTLTTSTNAHSGYLIKQYISGLPTSATSTISAFSAGTYASPNSWQAGDTGFGYTSSDTSVGGSNLFQPVTCIGTRLKTVPGCYARAATSGPGDIVADNTSTVTGTPITNEIFTLTYRVTVPSTQSKGTYNLKLLFTPVPAY